MLVLKNLSLVGGEGCAKFGGDWSGGLGMKSRYRFKNAKSYQVPTF